MGRDVIDRGTDERTAKGDLVKRDVFNEAGSLIGRGRRVKPPIERVGLDDELIVAALAYRNDYDLAVHRVRESEEGPRIRSNVPPTLMPDAVLDAMQRLGRARAAMGPTHYVVTRVVCDEIGLTDLGRMLGRNRQELAGVLKCGLEALADAMEGRRG